MLLIYREINSPRPKTYRALSSINLPRLSSINLPRLSSVSEARPKTYRASVLLIHRGINSPRPKIHRALKFTADYRALPRYVER